MNPGPPKLRVLIVDDAPHDVEIIARLLRDGGIDADCQSAATRETLRDRLVRFQPDILLCDYTIPGFGGAEALAIAREIRPDIPFIFVSGTIGEERAIEALKAGATDYVLKTNLARLVPAFTRALAEAQREVSRQEARRHLETQYDVARILAEAPSFDEALPPLFRLVCEREGFAASSLWHVDQAGTTLHCIHVWTDDTTALAAFAEKSRQLSLPASLAGRVWKARRPVWIRDIADDQRFTRAPEAMRSGLRMAAAFPVTIRGEITGVVDFFGRTIREEDTDLAAMLSAIGNHIGQFMERQAQQAHISKLNRIHAVLSGINSVIVRARDRRQLFNEACRIAVEHGKFGIAWIGEFDRDTLDCTPVAWAGLQAQELIESKGTARLDVPQGRGVLGRAVRDKKPVYCNDITAERLIGGKRRQEAVRRGYRSLMVLPLMLGGEVAATLALFARELDYFTAEEVKLLTELAGDISFALEYLDKQDQLKYLAYYDVLTNLPNRDLFHDRLSRLIEAAIRGQHKVAVIVIYLERFGLVNDTFGRHAGDAVLREVGKRLTGAIRGTDTAAAIAAENVARISPIRYAVALGELREAGDVARVLEERILPSLSEPFRMGDEDQELILPVKLGVALFPPDGAQAHTLVERAEAALRNARASDAQYLFYEPEMNSRVAAALLLENKLRRALEREQFVLHYQPKVDLTTGSMVGLEALIRWQDPDSGLVPPGQFIGILEESGLILQVGQWALRQAIRDCLAWRERGLTVPRIAVNVSPIQLQHRNFVQDVEATLAGHGEQFDFEITESVIMQNIDENIVRLRAIRDMSIGVAIDDFGTGYSSLAYLARLPVNTVKIDRAFVSALGRSRVDTSIVSTIISLARSLSVRVVAEGVETEEQVDTLRHLRCDEMQGYYVSRPLPFAKISDAIAAATRALSR